MIASRILKLVSLIIAGDLNCMIGLDELWGHSGKVDTMAEVIIDAIMDYNYVDIFHSKVVPTWDNDRAEVAYVAKRMDRFLLHE